ncbi:MAG: DUF2520 domain-containing protein [Bacteroidota bacterium]
MTPPSSIVLIGAGRVGANLLRHCARLGLPVSTVIEIDPARHPLLRDAHPGVEVCSAFPSRLPDETQFCIIAVEDRQIAVVARELAEQTVFPSELTAFHCSGMLDSSVLTPLADLRCLVGSIHPMQSFSSDSLPAEALRGIGCGIEGNDDFWSEGQRFAEYMDWRPVRIDAGKKALYHIANVFAGNFPTVLAALSETMLRESAANPADAHLSHLLPMMRTVLDRLRDTPAAEVLTGPAARGDHDTILRHLDALEAIDPQLRSVYESLTRAALTMRQR